MFLGLLVNVVEVLGSSTSLALIFASSSSRDTDFATFEHMSCNAVINSYSLRIAVVYRPPPSQQNGLTTNYFLEEEWPKFLSDLATVDKNIIVTGDLNFHLDKVTDKDTMKFNRILHSCGMKQHVNEPTHVRGHMLDVVITQEADNTVSMVEVINPGLN